MGDPRGYVLVVEDDRHIRELMCEALRGAGLEVTEAADGEEAVKSARARRPAAIVLDLGLPLLDGVAVADRIYGIYDASIPFIVVTAGGRAEDASRIRPVAQITKPFDVADLVSAVTRAVAPSHGTNGQVKPQTAGT
jgi:two-component system, OmpR family, response regulator